MVTSYVKKGDAAAPHPNLKQIHTGNRVQEIADDISNDLFSGKGSDFSNFIPTVCGVGSSKMIRRLQMCQTAKKNTDVHTVSIFPLYSRLSMPPWLCQKSKKYSIAKQKVLTWSLSMWILHVAKLATT